MLLNYVLTKSYLILAILIVTDGSRMETSYRCDLIELNHKVDETGCPVFTQIILWNWKPEVCRHHVDAWWLVDATSSLPTKTPTGWKVYRTDGQNRISSVIAKSYHKTTTTNDPEMDDRKVWHESRRQKL